ncbi:MAG: biotin transporter BioY [Oscillospiraceae bacterium]|nr:biotin transporter BioY [Oscillospiraceae bacterium]
MKITVKDTCLIGVFAAVIAAMSLLSIPMPLGVPLTMQTFAIPLAGVILGARKSAAAVLVYLLLGAVGLPVFAGFKGGIAVFAGPTGGFLLSFPIYAFIVGIAAEKGGKIRLALGLLIGAVVMFFIGGILWPTLVIGATLRAALLGWVLPFLVTDLLKIIMVFVVGVSMRRLLIKNGVLSVKGV